MLVGSETMSLVTSGEVAQLASLPPEEDVYDEDDSHAQIERHMIMDYHDGVGCKSETRHLCERDHYPQVRAEYGVLGLLWLTTTGPHYQDFQECYEEATRLLTEICAERP